MPAGVQTHTSCPNCKRCGFEPHPALHFSPRDASKGDYSLFFKVCVSEFGVEVIVMCCVLDNSHLYVRKACN